MRCLFGAHDSARQQPLVRFGAARRHHPGMVVPASVTPEVGPRCGWALSGTPFSSGEPRGLRSGCSTRAPGDGIMARTTECQLFGASSAPATKRRKGARLLADTAEEALMTSSNVHLTPISPRRCVVCGDEDREAIDRDLIRKRRTQTDIARQLDVDRSTISRCRPQRTTSGSCSRQAKSSTSRQSSVEDPPDSTTATPLSTARSRRSKQRIPRRGSIDGTSGRTRFRQPTPPICADMCGCERFSVVTLL